MPGQSWTDKEKQSLVQQIKQGKDLSRLRIKGRNMAGINNQRQRLRMAGRLGDLCPPCPIRAWTMPALRTLQDLTTNHWLGLSAKKIAFLGVLNGRSIDSISGMMRRHGLGNPNVKRRARKAIRLSKEQRTALKKYLKGEGRFRPTREVARKLGIAEKKVRRYRHQLGLRLSWHAARSSAEYRARMKEHVAQLPEIMKKVWRKRREQRQQEFLQKVQELERDRSSIPRRPCLGCGAHWFATRYFYHYRKKRMRGREVVLFSRVCRLCRRKMMKRRLKRRDQLVASRG